ncbi:hypothetical protein M413DRAFT_33183 [Hebeloma cylindrosporum]|uniref:Uncharacterized protein n=1 Tax=Hebeloma cylindrosporum TaxID=76867 RepID=A0A0C2Y0F5_HEBCY|nr:hypothetical protein M413DRAFT_33183 [Hebeloma cylindrosporum h7]
MSLYPIHTTNEEYPPNIPTHIHIRLVRSHRSPPLPILTKRTKKPAYSAFQLAAELYETVGDLLCNLPGS